MNSSFDNDLSLESSFSSSSSRVAAVCVEDFDDSPHSDATSPFTPPPSLNSDFVEKVPREKRILGARPVGTAGIVKGKRKPGSDDPKPKRVGSMKKGRLKDSESSPLGIDKDIYLPSRSLPSATINKLKPDNFVNAQTNRLELVEHVRASLKSMKLI
eukprot:TRINITY_DN6243_c0_g1_i1.p2 TRINITY_DN6243_c0_g1~~TRINITY_DN6243_c0_g1_i1.p2  ORF type:complete len:157 (-),score=45.59 TRINITY_DN6243_c0_g1_i1:438-908(-)